MIRRRILFSAVAAIAVVAAVTFTAAAGSSGADLAASVPSVVVGQVHVDGITGDNGATELDLYSFSWGAQRSPGTTGKVTIRDLNFTRKMDSATPKLMRATLIGQHIKSAVIGVFRPGTRQRYMQYTLTEVLISGYSHGASGLPDSYPVETVSLGFGRVCLSALNAAGEPIQTSCFLAGS